ncbi:MAG: alpha/beta fold hydrolase [Candidatus Omnitrophica bacterium]|jgi:carboxylesterase|nr:alpha/beta fold hydrolase [Candidatus Omnitrophota bacterium]
MSVLFSLDPRNFKKHKPVGALSKDKGLYFPGDNGSAVILIHGLTGTPNEMKYLATYLNKRGYTVICPKLANHGESMWVLKNTSWQDIYESLREVLTTGEAARFNGPIFTSGLSMGALYALLLADEFKDRVRGASCLAPTLFYDGWNTPLSNLFFPLAYTPVRYIAYFKESPPYGIKNEIIQQRIHKYYATARLDDLEGAEQYGYPFFPVTLLHQLQLMVRHVKKRLPEMEFPVQLIQAKDDDVASVKNSKFIYDRVRSEMKEMILLYNSYHVITADQERETVAEKVAEFFYRVRMSA